MSGLMPSAGALLLILSTAAAAQTAQDHLKKARTLVAKKQFAPALKLVDKATAEAGNDYETTLELLELSGTCNAALKKAGPAKIAFQKLLSLAPTYTLSRKGPPPVLKAFEDAKATAEPLTILPATPEMGTGKISEIAVEVRSDALKLAKTIVFNFRVAGGKWKVRASPAALGRVDARVDAVDKVEWYATVLGTNDAEIMRIRNVDSPITHVYIPPSTAPAAAPPALRDLPDDAPRQAEATKPELAPARESGTPIDVVEAGTGKARWVAPISVTFIVLGVASVGAGSYFGARSGSLFPNGARRRFADATADGSPVKNFTRERALHFDAQARDNALIANTLWIAGGALVLTGILIAIFGPDEAAH